MKRRILSLVLALAMVLSLGFTAFAEGETEAEIVDAAFALDAGASLEGEKTLTGEVSAVVTPYSAQYENVTVNITVKNSAGEDKTIQCFRIKGEDAATVAAGDVITVTGIIKNYNGTIEFDAGSTFVTVSSGEAAPLPETEAEILDAAFALENNTALTGTYSLTGVVDSIVTAYSEQYGNITVNLKVGDKVVQCYRMVGDCAATLAEGDTITVTGALKNFRGTVEFDTGCKAEAWTTAVIGENAGWQSKDYAPAEGNEDVLVPRFRYSVKDGYLNAAALFNLPLTKGTGNGNSTFFRVWVKTDKAQTSYRYFYEVYVKADDTLGFRAADNIVGTYDGLNKPTNNAESAYEYNMVEISEGVLAEIKIPLEEIGVTNYLAAYLTASIEPATGGAAKNQCVYFPALGEIDGAVKHITSGTWTEENGNVGLVLIDYSKQVVDLGEVKILNTITFTADDASIGTVRISGSYDGEEFYDLNNNGAAKVNAETGVASVDLSKQGYIQVRYLKVEGTDVRGALTATYKEADEGAFIAPPSGPYDFGSTNAQGYGIVMLENRVVDINAVKGDDYVVAPKNNQLIITQKVANGVYKIIANSVNAWPNQGHPELITAGIEGLNISEEGIITLADDQFAFVIVSSGAITTAGDEQTAPAKRIDRGLGTNGYLRVDGDKLTLHVNEPEAVEVVPVESGEFAIARFAGYVSGDVSILVRQEGKTTVSEITGGKDYNAYTLIVCDSEGKVIDLDLRGPGRPAGVKGDYVVPEGGFIIAINRDVKDYPTSVGAAGDGTEMFVAGGVKVGDSIKLYGVDLAALATAAAGDVLANASFDVIEAEVVADPLEPDNYLWLKGTTACLPGITFRVPADKFAPGEFTIKALVMFGEDCVSNGGSVYLNCYPYDDAGNLLSWIDYAKNTNAELGKWAIAEFTLNPAKNGVEPSFLNMGIGFWSAIGSVNIGYIQIIQNGEVVWSVDFEYGYDLTGAANMTAENKGTVWDVVGAKEKPVIEPYAVTVTVKDNAILTDGRTGFDGDWGAVSGSDVLLVTNTECKTAPMVVTIIDELDEVKEIQKVSLDLYHCANVMIGYPEGKAEVFVSIDGENYTSLGEFDLLAASLKAGEDRTYGTLSSAFEFDPVEAKFVKIVLNAGSNADVLGETPVDGKIYWEFIAIAEIAVQEKEIIPGKYAIKTFAGYSTEDVSIVVRQGEKITIGDVTGKDYNYYRVILVDADGYVVDVLEKLGRVPATITDEDPGHGPEDGRKDLVVIPEGGFAIGIHNNVIVAEGSVYADLFGEGGVKVDDQIELIGVDLAALVETAAQTALEGATFNHISNNFVEVPEGAIAIDYALDWMANISVIYTRLATGEKTVGEVTAVTTGKAQDCTWWYAITVDKDGKVTNFIGMVDKTNLEIPEGGYILLAHGESAAMSVLSAVQLESVVTLYNCDLEAFANLKDGVKLRNAAFTVSEPEKSLAYGKSYTTPENTRTDAHKDDGVKLTDGVKSLNPGGGTYSGWGKDSSGVPVDVNVVVDLADEYFVNKFTVHAAGGDWGILQIKGFNVEVSLDGETFTAVSGVASVSATASNGKWATNNFTVELPVSVKARYVKFIVNRDPDGQFTWIDEVEVWEGEEPVPTAIDGKFNDAIWAAAEWTTYDGYNVGTWQQYQKKGTYTYTTALAEDDEYVYFAGVVSTTGVTQIRTWFRTNPEASLYTHFMDIFSDGRHFIKKNQSLTENSGAEIESTFEYVLLEADGKTYVEYKVKKAELDINGDFEYIPQASVDGFSNLLGAEIVHGNFIYGGKTMTNFPWVNWPKAPEEDYVGLIPVTNHWIFTDIDYAGSVGVINKAHYERQEDGHLRFVVGGTELWPLVTYYYEEPKVYNVERGTLHYSFTTDRCNTNITFIFEDANGASYSFPLANTALGLEAGQYDAGSGDIRPGTYEGEIALSDLVASKAYLYSTAFPEPDAAELKFTGIIVYACGITDPAGGVYIDDLSVTVAPAPAVTETVFDLGEVVAITGVTFTADNAEGLETVEILGSADGVNFYRLNAEASVTVTDGVATLNSLTGSNHRAYLNIRYIKVIGEPDVNGKIDIDEVDTGINPEGPYTAVGLEEKGYGIVIWTAEDAPDGFGVNDKGYTSNGKTLNLNSAMITIAEKVGSGVYKILWNDSNGWSKETGAAHLNTPEGVEGIDYRDGKVYLKANQIAIFTMSSGAYETVGDGEYSNAKWILRGIVSGGFVKLGDGVIYVYNEKPEVTELTEVDVADFDGDGKVTSDDAVYLLRAVLFPERYEIKVLAPFYGDKTPTSDDAVYLLRAVLFPERYPLLDK